MSLLHDRRSKKKGQTRKIICNLVFVVFLILLFSHRFINIAWTDNFQNDEGVHALVSYTLMHDTRIYEDIRFAHPPLMPYIGAVYMSIMGVGFVQLRFLAILASVLVPVYLYFIIRETFKEDKQIYFASSLAVLPLSILSIINSYSRVYYIEPFVTFMSCAAVYATTKKTKNAFFASGLFSATAVLLKFWAVPAVAAILVYILWAEKTKIRYFVLGFFVVMILFFIHLAVSEKALHYILFQASRGRWTFMQKTKPLWKFYKVIPFISVASIPFLFSRGHKLVFLWTLSTFIFFYTLMPDAVSHHTYFMVPVFTLSTAVFASEFGPKRIWFWVILVLLIYSIADKKHIQDIQIQMRTHDTKLTNVAGYVEANTNEGDTILSDYMMIPFIAKRRQAGNIIDVSEAAIYYDIITSEDLITLSEKEKPKYIIVESRFNNPKLKVFMNYVRETYVQEEPPGFDSKPFEVYRRK